MAAISFPFGVDKSNFNYRGNKRTVEVLFNPSASYTTGGDDVPIATLGLSEVHAVEQLSRIGGTSMNPGLSFSLGGTAKAPKLLFYDGNSTEVANASNNAGRTSLIRFIGI